MNFAHYSVSHSFSRLLGLQPLPKASSSQSRSDDGRSLIEADIAEALCVPKLMTIIGRLPPAMSVMERSHLIALERDATATEQKLLA